MVYNISEQNSRLKLDLQSDSQSKAYFCRVSERERERERERECESRQLLICQLRAVLSVDMKSFFQQVTFYNNEEIFDDTVTVCQSDTKWT